ncbi:MAG: hypothetical protein DMF62_16100 [Acidobacteria bacterium]|nr:MAG: hypothetical protein DMF62_16100 [Acidobacteriota bacterium]
MSSTNLQKRVFSFCLAITFAVLPIASIAQTAISLPKNKYRLQDDIQLGQKTAAQVEQQFPILNDEDATRYVERVGQRLVANIPQAFQQPAFQYRFKVVNASDINAFALPGGPMYVNRGMIEAARNEGEMAGVMAHEISHVALRHATAQATKQSSAGSMLGQLGLILGGAVLGGQSGAEMGQMAASAWMTKYSREYESQADILGARIMADAGYDPRDLANMFQTIARQGGSRGPEWLSSHPDPGNRYQKINQEATYLRVSQNPIKITRDFERVQARLRAMPPTLTMAQIQQGGYRNGQGTYGQGTGQGTYGQGTSGSVGAISNGRYSSRVEYPSSRTRVYSAGNSLSLSIPSNWREFPDQSIISFAPEGAYGSQGITHGIMIGAFQPQSSSLRTESETFVRKLLQSNQYLQDESGLTRAYIASQQGYADALSGRSSITNREEKVSIYTTQMRDGRVFFMMTVAPESDAFQYENAFRNIVSSIRLN